MGVHNENQVFNQYISRLQTEFILIDHGPCPDWSREEHIRRRDTLYLILGGKGRITIDGSVYYPKRGSLVLLPRGSRVSLYSENDTCYNKYWCDFLMNIDGVSLFRMLDFPYTAESVDMDRAVSLFERLDELHLKTDTASAILIKAALLELVAMLLPSGGEVRMKSQKNIAFSDKINSFISDNIASDLHVRVMAEKMGFNQKYFISLFRKNFGTTPAHYVKIMRLEKAKHELLYSDAKVASITGAVGYSCGQKLARDFKAYTGMTPTEFRKKFK